MRQYPRRVYKDSEDLLVQNETEERKASADGYESHWMEEINARRKGTEKEILRAKVTKTETKVEAKKPVKKAVKRKAKKKVGE